MRSFRKETSGFSIKSFPSHSGTSSCVPCHLGGIYPKWTGEQNLGSKGSDAEEKALDEKFKAVERAIASDIIKKL